MTEADIFALLELGENQSLEFKREFPKATKNLAKEIAAFATSNHGTILVGVDDLGQVVGLDKAGSNAERKILAARIEGICASSVAPTVCPKISFQKVGGKWVMAIEVEKGADAIYYADGRPYIRQVSAARVATPDEVQKLVVGDEIIRRIEALEARRTPEQSTAAAIAGQGELATMNLGQLYEWLDRLSITSTRNI